MPLNQSVLGNIVVQVTDNNMADDAAGKAVSPLSLCPIELEFEMKTPPLKPLSLSKSPDSPGSPRSPNIRSYSLTPRGSRAEVVHVQFGEKRTTLSPKGDSSRKSIPYLRLSPSVRRKFLSPNAEKLPTFSLGSSRVAPPSPYSKMSLTAFTKYYVPENVDEGAKPVIYRTFKVAPALHHSAKDKKMSKKYRTTYTTYDISNPKVAFF